MCHLFSISLGLSGHSLLRVILSYFGGLSGKRGAGVPGYGVPGYGVPEYGVRGPGVPGSRGVENAGSGGKRRVPFFFAKI